MVHSIEDQAWELTDITREKTLTAISHVANGKTPLEKLNIARKIPIRNIKRVGEYAKNKHRPVSIKFVNRASADFLIDHKKQLPKGVFVDREYNSERKRKDKNSDPS